LGYDRLIADKYKTQRCQHPDDDASLGFLVIRCVLLTPVPMSTGDKQGRITDVKN
jgi:hypothetical protein